MSLYFYHNYVATLPRVEVTAHFESVLKMLSEAQSCANVVPEKDWSKITSTIIPSVKTRNYTQQRHVLFCRYFQNNSGLCQVVQKCCRALMDHVVKVSKPLFESLECNG